MPEQIQEISKLSEYGILGIVCILFIITIGALWKRLNTIQDARLQDMKESNDKIISLARDLDGTLNALKGVVEGLRRA
jgi:Na+/proline symporter